jgi:hypothetical protein
MSFADDKSLDDFLPIGLTEEEKQQLDKIGEMHQS